MLKRHSMNNKYEKPIFHYNCRYDATLNETSQHGVLETKISMLRREFVISILCYKWYNSGLCYPREICYFWGKSIWRWAKILAVLLLCIVNILNTTYTKQSQVYKMHISKQSTLWYFNCSCEVFRLCSFQTLLLGKI